MHVVIWSSLAILLLAGSPKPERYQVEQGHITFESEAPLELIRASSSSVQGLMDTDLKTFAFQVALNRFDGFNSELQREHFCEKFMECGRYPKATFRGKIIDDVSFSETAKHDVRVKGLLLVHGEEQERIVRGTLEIGPGGIAIDTEFFVHLADHHIEIPKVVNQNIAEKILVRVHLELFPR